MTSKESELTSRGDECLPFLQMGQHCSGSYTGLTHSGTAQSDTTQCTSLFGSQRHHSQGDGCGQRRKETGNLGQMTQQLSPCVYVCVHVHACLCFSHMHILNSFRCVKKKCCDKQRHRLINYSHPQFYQGTFALTKTAYTTAGLQQNLQK